MRLVVLFVVCCVADCWLNPEPGEDLLARCELKETLSSEFARKTGLASVCNSTSETTCLALLLLDQSLARALGYEPLVGLPPSGRMEPEASSLALKDHVDLGFLPRVTREEFVRVYSWAAYAHSVEGMST